jgi:hypothetical protein
LERRACNRLADGQRRQHGSARMIFVGHRCTEERHEAVAEELIDRTLEAMDFTHRGLEERVEHLVHLVWADPRGQGRGVGNVAGP